MHITQQMEQFSRAYVRAIAAQAGCNTSVPDVDDDSIDLELSIKDIPNVKYSRGRLDLQLKSTTDFKISDGKFSFPLPIKNYNDLRGKVVYPRILVVLLLPSLLQNWSRQTQKCLRLRYCAYWLSLAGYPESHNTTSVTVHLPSDNIFSVEFLQRAMPAITNGESL